MACALTQGYTLDCKEGIGGIKNAYFIAFNDVSNIVEASGVVTALTKATGKRFYKYQLAQETANFTEQLQSNIQNGTIFYEQNLTVILNNRTTAIRNEVLLLAKNTLIAVVEDYNGKYWLLGKQAGLDIQDGQAGSGTARGDRNGFELTFKGAEKELAVEVNSTVAAALETAGS